jgi:hypothetical protein
MMETAIKVKKRILLGLRILAFFVDPVSGVDRRRVEARFG